MHRSGVGADLCVRPRWDVDEKPAEISSPQSEIEWVDKIGVWARCIVPIRRQSNPEIANMKFKAVIFDLDGTLLDTIEDIADSCNAVFLQNELPEFSVEHYTEVVGNGIRNVLKATLPEARCSDEFMDKLIREFEDVYLENNCNKTRPYPGVAGLLELLQEKGIQTAVLSNKPHDHTVKCIGTYFPSHPFREVLGHGEGMPLKPDPTSALLISEKLSIPVSETALVGDSPMDIQTGLAAHMSPVGVTWGFRSEENIRTAGECAIAHSPDELGELIVGNR